MDETKNEAPVATKKAQPIRGLALGRTVHFAEKVGREPAKKQGDVGDPIYGPAVGVIVDIHNSETGCVSLRLLRAREETPPLVTSVLHDESGAPGTWRFPSLV